MLIVLIVAFNKRIHYIFDSHSWTTSKSRLVALEGTTES